MDIYPILFVIAWDAIILSLDKYFLIVFNPLMIAIFCQANEKLYIRLMRLNENQSSAL